MIDRPYCREHYAECICSRCKYDMDNCCGRLSFSTYLCPFAKCSEFMPGTALREKRPESTRRPEPTEKPSA